MPKARARDQRPVLGPTLRSYLDNWAYTEEQKLQESKRDEEACWLQGRPGLGAVPGPDGIWEEVGYAGEGRHKVPRGVYPRRIGVRLGEEGWKVDTALVWFCGTPGWDPSGHSSNMVTVSGVSGALPSHQA